MAISWHIHNDRLDIALLHADTIAGNFIDLFDKKYSDIDRIWLNVAKIVDLEADGLRRFVEAYPDHPLSGRYQEILDGVYADFTESRESQPPT